MNESQYYLKGRVKVIEIALSTARWRYTMGTMQHISTSHGTHTNESWHKLGSHGDQNHIMSHGTLMNESWYNLKR